MANEAEPMACRSRSVVTATGLSTCTSTSRRGAARRLHVKSACPMTVSSSLATSERPFEAGARHVDLLDERQSRLPGLDALAESGALVVTANEHVEIVDALIEGSSKKVERLMTRHLGHTRGVWAGVQE
jgi:hypothetical protein